MASGIDRTYLKVEGKNLSLRFERGWATYAQDKVHVGADTMIPRDLWGVQSAVQIKYPKASFITRDPMGAKRSDYEATFTFDFGEGERVFAVNLCMDNSNREFIQKVQALLEGMVYCQHPHSFGVLVSNLRQLLLFDTAKVSANA